MGLCRRCCVCMRLPQANIIASRIIAGLCVEVFYFAMIAESERSGVSKRYCSSDVVSNHVLRDPWLYGRDSQSGNIADMPCCFEHHMRSQVYFVGLGA